MTAAWTADHIERLRKMWGQGKSAGDIAKALSQGGKSFSRNAVIGKANRLGLSSGKKTSRSEPKQTKTAKPVKAIKGQKAAPPKKVAAKVESHKSRKPLQKPQDIKKEQKASKIEKVVQKQPVVPPVASSKLPAKPSGPKITILSLTERMCKWPEGDPRLPGFYFCGKTIEPGHPYCYDHVLMAYQPARRREDERKNGIS